MDGVLTRRGMLCFLSVLVTGVGRDVVAQVTAPLSVGVPAPDFTLPSTTGEKISLSQFRGRKLVLLEFYVHDFGPT